MSLGGVALQWSLAAIVYWGGRKAGWSQRGAVEARALSTDYLVTLFLLCGVVALIFLIVVLRELYQVRLALARGARELRDLRTRAQARDQARERLALGNLSRLRGA